MTDRRACPYCAERYPLQLVYTEDENHKLVETWVHHLPNDSRVICNSYDDLAKEILET